MKTLTLKPEAFNTELLSQLKPDQLNWSGDKHIKLVESMVKHLKDKDGNPIKLTGTRIEHTMALVFRPTEDLQRAAWKQAFADAGYELDADADKTFLLLLNAPQFATFLSKTENPVTGRPFIVKEKKKGVKKDTLAALLKVTPPTTPTTESMTVASTKAASSNPATTAPASATPITEVKETAAV